MQLNDSSAVVISARSFEFDGHKAYSVTERTTGRLMGHVARAHRSRGQWAYLGVTEDRGTWYLGGWTRADAVDHLMSWWAPSAAWLLPAPDANPNLCQPVSGEYLSESDLHSRLTDHYALAPWHADELIQDAYRFGAEGRAAVFGPHRIAYRGKAMAFHCYDA